jgi:hypothetical protein
MTSVEKKLDRRLTQRTRLIPNGGEISKVSHSHESPSNTVIAYTEKRSVQFSYVLGKTGRNCLELYKTCYIFYRFAMN